MFARWLELVGVEREAMTFRLAIHRQADVQGALSFWSDILGVPAHTFLATTLKRHNPKTSRKLIGDAYRGCLQITVRRSIDLTGGSTDGSARSSTTSRSVRRWRQTAGSSRLLPEILVPSGVV